MHGAIYAVLLFLPWLHLTRAMRGEPVSRASVRNAHRAAYAAAVGMLICHIVYLIAEISLYPYAAFAEWLPIFAVLTIAGALTLGAGLASVSRANKRFAERETQGEGGGDIALPDGSYIAPFAWAWASMVIGSAWWCAILLNAIFSQFFR